MTRTMFLQYRFSLASWLSLLGDGCLLRKRHWVHAHPCWSGGASVPGWKRVSGSNGNNRRLPCGQHQQRLQSDRCTLAFFIVACCRKHSRPGDGRRQGTVGDTPIGMSTSVFSINVCFSNMLYVARWGRQQPNPCRWDDAWPSGTSSSCFWLCRSEGLAGDTRRVHSDKGSIRQHQQVCVEGL